MTLKETRQQILDSDEFVLNEFHRLKYLFGLKEVIRFNDIRSSSGMGESVADHIYGMMVLSQYFLTLEDKESAFDQNKIFKIITWHDIEEIEVGDEISYLKTPARRAEEAVAEQVAIGKSPISMQEKIHDMLSEYAAQETAEATFVKGIDRLEGLFQIYCEKGKSVAVTMEATYEQVRSSKAPYVKDWPYMERFYEVIIARMVAEGFLIS